MRRKKSDWPGYISKREFAAGVFCHHTAKYARALILYVISQNPKLLDELKDAGWQLHARLYSPQEVEVFRKYGFEMNTRRQSLTTS